VTTTPTDPQEPPRAYPSRAPEPPDAGFAPVGAATVQYPYGAPHDQQPDDPEPFGEPPYDQQSGYPRAPGYDGQEPYGTPYARLPQGMPPLASWWQRVAAYLLDNVLVGVALALIFSWFDSGIIDGIGYFLGLMWAVYNAYLAGISGQSYGKRAVNIRLAKLADGQPVGAGFGLLRWLLDWAFFALFFFAGVLNFLWPLWDRRSQTWCDKIASSVVVRSN
jgi:uncharacterized RDD family membrane protein YckC